MSQVPALSQVSSAPADLKGPPLRRAMSYVTIAWLFGAFWMHAQAGAPLTMFAKTLGLSNFEFGLLAAMPFMAALLSLPASVLIDRTGHRKGIFMVALYLNRLLWIPIALVPMWIVLYGGENHAPWAIFAFLAFFFLMHAGQCVGGPAWISWMADVIPDRVRGRYFARRRQLGIFTGIPAALLAGWALDRYCGHGQSERTILITCSVIFIVAAAVGLVDVFLFHFVPHRPVMKAKQPVIQMLLHPLKNRRFVWFSACTAILWFAVAGQGQFVSKFLIDHLKISSTQVQMIVLVVPLLTQLVVLPIWGRAIDRYGKKPAMMTGMLGIVPVGAGWCLMNSGHVWPGYLLASCGAAFWTGVEVANFNMVLELSGTDADGNHGGTAYVAINLVIVNIAGMAGGIFYGSIAEALTDFQWVSGIAWLAPMSFYEVLFAVSAVLRLAAFLPLLRVHEPEARPTFDLMRFMAGNLYNNVAGAVLLPVRLIRRDTGEDEAESSKHE
ncbi:MAG: MFS transporter [Burkholderiales bacterium]|nr:MFS transporter [Phycisphaerae bacterium]